MRTRSLALALAAVVCALAAARADDRGAESPTPAGPPAGTTEEERPASPEGPRAPANSETLPEVVVKGRQDSLLGTADSASQGTTGAAQLADRPLLRSGELLETVPGVIVTQHAGGGKANQYFVRGFNLDHGTDFAVFLDSMPLNLPSHAHGEGYADMNAVIPETVERLNYEKGPYYADVGNYGSAGSAHLVFYKTLPKSFATVEAGMYGYERGVFGISQQVGSGHLLYAGEVSHDDGPWEHPDDYRKFNGLLTYSRGDARGGFSVTARAYHGEWNSSDQIAASAVPLVGFFGSLNSSTGGASQRYSLQGEWHRSDGRSETAVAAYGFYYDLDLFSDFTYFLVDPARGDQFEQADRRWVGGLDARHAIFGQWFGHEVESSVGVQVRSDRVDNGLFQTEDRMRVAKLDSETGTVLPAVTQKHRFTDTQIGFWAEQRVEWSDKVRSVVGLRGDVQYVDVTSLTDSANSGTSLDFQPSPKGSLTFGPWRATELYVQGGFGFHSNDARGTTQTVEPVSAANPRRGTRVAPIPGLIETKGAEVGVRTLAVSHLQSTVSLWYLHSDSELQQAGDTGGTVPSKVPSNRYGVEWANYFTPMEHLAFDLDVADSVARFTARDPDDAAPGSAGGRRVPEAVGLVIASGATLHDWHRVSASLRLRYFGPRDLTSDGIFRSKETLLLNGEVGYQLTPTWRIGAEVLNVLDRRDHDIDYAYASRVSPAAPARFEDVFHPVEPIQVRFGVRATF